MSLFDFASTSKTETTEISIHWCRCPQLVDFLDFAEVLTVSATSRSMLLPYTAFSDNVTYSLMT